MAQPLPPRRHSDFWRRFALVCLVVFICVGVFVTMLAYWGLARARMALQNIHVPNVQQAVTNSLNSKIQGSTQDANLGLDLLSYSHKTSFSGAYNQNKKIRVSGPELYVFATAQDVAGNGGSVRVLRADGTQIGSTIILSSSSSFSAQVQGVVSPHNKSLAAGDGRFEVPAEDITIEVKIMGVWNVQILSNGDVTPK